MVPKIFGLSMCLHVIYKVQFKWMHRVTVGDIPWFFIIFFILKIYLEMFAETAVFRINFPWFASTCQMSADIVNM